MNEHVKVTDPKPPNIFQRMLTRLSQFINEDFVRSYLIGIGILFTGIGFTWVIFPTRGREIGIDWVPAVTTQIVGIGWIITGVATFMIGLIGRRRYDWGFSIAQFFPLVMAFIFAVSQMMSFIPDDYYVNGSPTAITSVISYVLFWFPSFIFGRAWEYSQESARKYAILLDERDDLYRQLMLYLDPEAHEHKSGQAHG